jgi:hypothetical protein
MSSSSGDYQHRARGVLHVSANPSRAVSARTFAGSATPSIVALSAEGTRAVILAPSGTMANRSTRTAQAMD